MLFRSKTHPRNAHGSESEPSSKLLEGVMIADQQGSANGASIKSHVRLDSEDSSAFDFQQKKTCCEGIKTSSKIL